jgi:hypothetical protein
VYQNYSPWRRASRVETCRILLRIKIILYTFWCISWCLLFRTFSCIYAPFVGSNITPYCSVHGYGTFSIQHWTVSSCSDYSSFISKVLFPFILALRYSPIHSYHALAIFLPNLFYPRTPSVLRLLFLAQSCRTVMSLSYRTHPTAIKNVWVCVMMTQRDI